MAGWVGNVGWLVADTLPTKLSRPAVSLAQERESSPARTGGLTTMLRHQLTASKKSMESMSRGRVNISKQP